MASPWEQISLDPPTEEEMLMMQMAQSQGESPEMALQAIPPAAPAVIPVQASAGMQAKKGAMQRPEVAALQAMQDKALQGQKAGIGIYEKSIQDLLQSSGGGIDFTPLAALVDSWTPGSHLTAAAAAQKPMTNEQRKVLATKLQDELQRRKSDYSKSQLDALKSQIMFGLGLEKASKPKDPSGDQSKAALFGRRMEQAEKNLTDLAKTGFDPTTPESAAQRTSVFPEGLKSEPAKLLSQAEENFLSAVLRRESGAAIGEGEMEKGSRQYFPRINDTPAVIAQKAANRRLAIKGLQTEAGPAWDALQQEVPQAPEEVREVNGVQYVKVPGGWKKAQ